MKMFCVRCGKELNKLQRAARLKRVKLAKGKVLAGPFCSQRCAGYNRGQGKAHE